MKRAALLLLVAASSACRENVAHDQPPMDQFFYPMGLALTPVLDGTTLTPVASGNQAMVVVSANFDLRYDQAEGSAVIAVDPSGSAGLADGALVTLGPGAQLGSYAGPLAVADVNTCASLGMDQAGQNQGFKPVAFSASRFTRQLYRFPLGSDGSVAPCEASKLCRFDLDPDLLDPSPIGLACRADGLRRSLFVGYLRAPAVGSIGPGTAWLSEFDLGNMNAPPRTFALAPGPVGSMAYDALTDRLYAVGRFAGLTAPLFILDLPACPSSMKNDAADPCPGPRLQTIDLYNALAGAELVGIALSNPQAGVPRRAFISVAVYNEGYAAAIRGRPPVDVGGALLVVDLQDDVIGEPLARVVSVVPLGIGAGPVQVLPVRPGLGDLVVVPSSGEGIIQVYDDQVGAVVRAVTLDQVTGAPQAGHIPWATAMQDQGTEALVYIASFADWTVSVLRVALADPSAADLIRYPPGHAQQGQPIRIGSPRP